MARLILASSSKYRKQQLKRLGLPFEALAHRCDEQDLKRTGLEPSELSRQLAVLKAQSLAAENADALILGSDQVVDLEGRILSKPGSRARAVAQLLEMRGRAHRLLTAVALVEGGTGRVLAEALDVHVMTMRADLTREALERYVDADLPLDCAGSYKIESLGVALFSSISGKDFTAIVGLPMVSVVTMLRDVNINVL